LDATRARKLLRAEEQRIQQELEGLRAQTGGDSELSNVDQHPADAGTELFEEERVQSMIDRLEQDLEAVERAMKRVDDGTYGLSIESGQPIPDSRLEAVPHAERTVEEQSRFEAEHRNSV
jgi:RNA polymerase-binding transcription factor DksA